MKALVFEEPYKVVYQDVDRFEPKPGWTTIQVSHAGICGSDLTIFAGKHPRAKAPLIMGHEFSGYIRSSGSQYPEGTLVTVFPYRPCGTCERCVHGQFHVCQSLKLIGIDLDGGMAEYVQVPDNAIYPVPEGTPPELAAFIEPVGITVHAVRKGGYIPGDSVLIFGAGGIGLSAAITLKNSGARHIMICEPNPARSALAKELGFDTLDASKDTLQQIYDRTDGQGAEFVFDCAGVQAVVSLLPDAVKINGKIVVVAGYKNPPAVNFQKGMFREFDIQFIRNCTRKDFEIARELVGQNLGYERLLNCILPLSDGAKGFAPLDSAYKVMLRIS